MSKTKIIMDCDPGHDDATAIMMAGMNPQLDLLGITVVKGNQTIEKTTKNTLEVCQTLGLNVPVYEGMSVPMVIPSPQTEERVHGKSGLDGPKFAPLTKKKEKKHAIQFIIETLMASDGDITLVPTGPLTNIAMAMRLEPRIISKIKEIVMMGGSYEHGNVTPSAEFNIYADAEAAYVVFTSGVHITMMGLDITRKALCFPVIVKRMRQHDNPAARLFGDMMDFFIKAQHDTYGWEGAPLHDPTTIAYLIDPSVITTKKMHTDIEIRSTQSYGRTNCDYFNLTDAPKNTSVAIAIDVDKFWDIVEDSIKLYD
ncbi:nucleoside hydrolase [Levilactobacillus acidifarinae]|uniref:Ribonucleoside hydrolase 2 n=1 Tax=Levilactobacillus acidifarinae DSM 19394 = JCM 15949 TaxID=1423715 RepID=A0A0R1LU82_9LACO|nr:nucleoside hydrolase [Levilactobacillus acidifarinae]KRK95962.1 ribonucleoside hydrolase 2 [Levilactobacillus acidifarinae DSM 19394]GEO69267.1 ribosylpyrimidine nucleosidase [Levilactobacillus acidifarinae]